MRVILLAAGTASRLRPLTDRTPKCLLEVGGRTILSRAIGALVSHGLRRFTIVDGFQGDHLRADVLAEFPAEWFEFIRNEDFATTNNAYSLLLARSEIPEPIFLLDSDIVFDRRVVARMLEKGPPDRLALRTRGELGDEEIKVRLDARGCVSELGKELDPRSSAGESVGLEVFSEATAAELFRVLDRRVREEKRVNEWYESSFVEMIHGGLALHPVDLGDLACMEIDTLEDLERARRAFGPATFRDVTAKSRPRLVS